MKPFLSTTHMFVVSRLLTQEEMGVMIVSTTC